jgi:hypothetical protein
MKQLQKSIIKYISSFLPRNDQNNLQYINKRVAFISGFKIKDSTFIKESELEVHMIEQENICLSDIEHKCMIMYNPKLKNTLNVEQFIFILDNTVSMDTMSHNMQFLMLIDTIVSMEVDYNPYITICVFGKTCIPIYNGYLSVLVNLILINEINFIKFSYYIENTIIRVVGKLTNEKINLNYLKLEISKINNSSIVLVINNECNNIDLFEDSINNFCKKYNCNIIIKKITEISFNLNLLIIGQKENKTALYNTVEYISTLAIPGATCVKCIITTDGCDTVSYSNTLPKNYQALCDKYSNTLEIIIVLFGNNTSAQYISDYCTIIPLPDPTNFSEVNKLILYEQNPHTCKFQIDKINVYLLNEEDNETILINKYNLINIPNTNAVNIKYTAKFPFSFEFNRKKILQQISKKCLENTLEYFKVKIFLNKYKKRLHDLHEYCCSLIDSINEMKIISLTYRNIITDYYTQIKAIIRKTDYYSIIINKYKNTDDDISNMPNNMPNNIKQLKDDYLLLNNLEEIKLKFNVKIKILPNEINKKEINMSLEMIQRVNEKSKSIIKLSPEKFVELELLCNNEYKCGVIHEENAFLRQVSGGCIKPNLVRTVTNSYSSNQPKIYMNHSTKTLSKPTVSRTYTSGPTLNRQMTGTNLSKPLYPGAISMYNTPYNHEFEIIKSNLKLPIHISSLNYKLFKKDIAINNTFKKLYIDEMILTIKNEIAEINLFLNDTTIKNKYHLF